MSSIKSLPNEALIDISFLPGASLFTATQVCKSWSNLITETSTLVTPLRIRLWSLYKKAVNTPSLPPPPPKGVFCWLSQSGIDDLLSELKSVPEAFELWLREWPSPALAGLIWPGLDRGLGVLCGLGVSRFNRSDCGFSFDPSCYNDFPNLVIDEDEDLCNLLVRNFSIVIPPDWEYKDCNKEELEVLGYHSKPTWKENAEYRVLLDDTHSSKRKGCYIGTVTVVDFSSTYRNWNPSHRMVISGAGNAMNGWVWKLDHTKTFRDELPLHKMLGQKNPRIAGDWIEWVERELEISTLHALGRMARKAAA